MIRTVKDGDECGKIDRLVTSGRETHVVWIMDVEYSLNIKVLL